MFVGHAQLQVSCSFAGPAHLQVFCDSDGPTQPPSPASSTQDSQFLSPVSAGSLQFLSIFSVFSTLLHGSTCSLLVACSTLESGSPVSALGHQAHHYTSSHRPFVSSPLSSTLVSCHSAWSMDFRHSAALCSSTSLAPSGSTWPLALPWSSVLCVFQHP